MAKILLVEDDEGLVDQLKSYLSAEGHALDSAGDGATAEELLKMYRYELIILDIDLPDTTGVSICAGFRSLGGTTPILMLTGKSSIRDKETGLDAGADDYLTKPFNARELSARIRSLLRRPQSPPSDVLRMQDLVVDTVAKTVTRGGDEVKLLPKEFAILVFMLRHRNQIFDADAILERVWPMEAESSPEAVRQCIKRLREKIDSDRDKSIITTIRGFGYTIYNE